MKRMLKKKETSTVLTISHAFNQKTLMKREKDVVAKKSNDQEMSKIIKT